MMFGSTESEHPRLTNGEITFGKIPTYVIAIHQRQTDGQTTCDRKTHFALKCIAR